MSPALEAMEGEQQRYGNNKGVVLEPFVHQVGGHSCVLRFSEQTICKPLIPREHQFYKSLPVEMRRYIPQYKGVVSVSFEEDEEGNLCLIAYPLNGGDHGELEKNVDLSDCEPKNKLLKWSNKKPGLLLENDNYSKERVRQHRKEEKLKSYNLDEEFERLKKSEVLYCSLEKGNVVSQIKHNPWSMKCHQQQLQRMKENAKHRNQYKFILLENLTWRYEVPCVLDLKMGTRQHGDDASEEKKANQIRKCQQSTSAIIGVRVCGMQVYQSDSGQLMFMNKYHGRKLTVPGFKEALFQFFHNGRFLLRELLEPVLRKLSELKAVLEAQESYRFYSSSLLIIYDGKKVQQQPRHRGGEEGDEEEEEEEEEGGEGAFAFTQQRKVRGKQGGSAAGGCSGGPGGSGGSCSVDVRMIDFAHTTCRYYGEDSVVHEGQDTGYIFGLQNLIEIIKELQDDSGD
ncbi:inositol hexakisphosphate kinase 2-like isoform X2 [Acipenser ruthenus]|uniref:inositol hexakisphosphate kinase 2-like isoform X2 n=1 Tax=Acipenser ruthenus TaxID=7906 RepID=UPI00274231D3|nr:inositol hexakisphosphate kinase 2-like isoform X2 [Acipenser ruthenus]